MLGIAVGVALSAPVDDPADVAFRLSALAIAILFGTGGGLGVVLTGGSLPLMLDTSRLTIAAKPGGRIEIMKAPKKPFMIQARQCRFTSSKSCSSRPSSIAPKCQAWSRGWIM